MEDNSIIVAGSALAKADELLESIKDAKTADDALWQMKVLDELLDKADECGRYANEFCLREAQILVKIATLPDHIEVSRRTGMIAWIRTKSMDEIKGILEECSNGTRISVIKARETRAHNKENSAQRVADEFKRIEGVIVQRYLEAGRVEISPEAYQSEWSIKEPMNLGLQRGSQQVIHSKLIQSHGAISTGDGSSTYIEVTHADRNEIRDAIELRLRSICFDLERVRKLCKAKRFVVPTTATDEVRTILGELENPEWLS